jgi:hypothetical protein
MANAKKTPAKSTVVEKTLQSALEKLAEAASAVDKAVTIRARDAKKLATATKRLTKRKASLGKRRKSAAARARKSPSGEARQALRAVSKELASTVKELAKARTLKAANASELALLRATQRRTKGYRKGIARVDRE